MSVSVQHDTRKPGHSRDAQKATVGAAVRSFLHDKDPLGIFPRRTLLNCGAVVLASAALFWASDSRATDLVLMQTEAIRQATAYYSDQPYDGLATAMSDGVSLFSEGLHYLATDATTGSMERLRASMGVSEAPGWSARLSDAVTSRLREGMDYATTALRGVTGKVVAGVAAAFPFLLGAARMAFEMKGIADTLIALYKRRRGISEEQRIERLEEQLADARAERDKLSRDLQAAAAKPALSDAEVRARLDRMEADIRRDRKRMTELMEKGVQRYLDDLDTRQISIKVPAPEAETLARNATLSGRSASGVLEDRLAQHARKAGAARKTGRALLTAAEQESIHETMSRAIRREDEDRLSVLRPANSRRSLDVAMRHLKLKHADLERRPALQRRTAAGLSADTTSFLARVEERRRARDADPEETRSLRWEDPTI